MIACVAALLLAAVDEQVPVPGKPTIKEVKVKVRKILDDMKAEGQISSHQNIRWMVEALGDGRWFFNMHTPEHGAELWQTDLWYDTYMIKDIRPGPEDSYPSHLAEFTGADGVAALYYAADDGLHGSELWRTEVNGNTALFRDIYPGSAASTPQSLVACGPRLFFGAKDATPLGSRRVHFDLISVLTCLEVLCNRPPGEMVGKRAVTSINSL